jgi:hypothetical protein
MACRPPSSIHWITPLPPIADGGPWPQEHCGAAWPNPNRTATTEKRTAVAVSPDSRNKWLSNSSRKVWVMLRRPSQKTVSQLYNVQALACPDTKANHISQHVASRSQREVNDPTITSSGKRPGAVMKSLECDGAAPPAQDDDACKRGMGRSNGVKFGESEIQAELRRTASASLPTSWGLLHRL